MLDKKDIQNIVEATTKANKAIFATKEDFDDLRRDFSDLQTSVDTYAKKANDYFQEMVVMNNNYHRLEGWIHQVAEKAGVVLKY
jgi:hypothetical protein